MMPSLPLELIEQICSLLCVHCQPPETCHNVDSHEARVSKTALSRLCRVSRRICAVSQPFLFHYYTTGNLPKAHHCGPRFHTQVVPEEDDELPAFLRSIIQSPGLATHVRTLQLVETDGISGCTPDLASLFISATNKLGASQHAPTREYLRAKIWQGFSGLPQSLIRIQRRKVHHWLEELAILLSPNVENLLIARDSFVQYEHIRDSGASFPALRTITVRGVSKNHHVHEASALFSAAPNLERLCSFQCSPFDGLSSWTVARPWSLNLKDVRRLVISDIGFEDLRLLVGCCPALRELEVSAVNIYWTSGVGYWEVSELLQALEPVQHKLRKLRLSHSRSHGDGSIVRPDGGEILWSFRRFDQLEELAIDQTAIDRRYRTLLSAEGFLFDGSLTEIFPPSIREVQFLYAKKRFIENIRRLAEDADSALPNLRAVHISLEEGIDKRDLGLQFIATIESAFESAGIRVHWDTIHAGGDGPELVHCGIAELKPDPCPMIGSAVSSMDRLVVQ